MSVYDALSSASTGSSNSSAKTGDAFNDLGTGDFIKMMVAELQYQDPMNPTDNAALLDQINQIRSISSSDKLSATLESVARGQSLMSAAQMIGKTVIGTDTSGNTVDGQVDRVTIENGEAKIYVGTSIVPLENITSIR